MLKSYCKRKSKRLLSAIIVVLILLQSLPLSHLVFAADTSFEDTSVSGYDYSVTEVTKDLASSLQGSNLILGKLPTDIKKSDGSDGYNDVGYLTDGIVDWDQQGMSNLTRSNVDDGGHITYDLGRELVYSGFLFTCSPGTKKPIAVLGKYVIYVSNNLETLYSDENIVVDYDNTGKNLCGQYIEITGEKPAGRYVGFSIVNTRAEGTGTLSYPTEMGIFGDIDFSNQYTLSATDIDELSNSYGKNLLAGIKAYKLLQSNGQVAKGDSTYLTDGDAAWVEGRNLISIGVGGSIIYDFRTNVKIDAIDFASTVVKFCPGEYQIFVSDEFDDLLSLSNCVAYVNNIGTGYLGRKIQFAEDYKPVGRYMAIKFLTVSADNASKTVYAEELAVYGNAVNFDSDAAYTVTSATAKSVSNDKANNLLNDTKPIYSTNPITDEKATKLVDADIGDNKHVDIKANKLRITYQLEQSTKISKLLFGGVHWDNEYDEVEYQFYVSNNLNDLYYPGNMVACYNNSEHIAAQWFTFISGYEPTGMYVGLNIVNNNNKANDKTARISELGVYGEACMEGVSVSTNITADEINNNDVLSVISGEIPTLEEDFTVSDDTLKMLTDGKSLTEQSDAKIDDCEGKTFTYELSNTTVIDSVAIASSGLSSAIGAYEIYFSDKLEDLYDFGIALGYSNGVGTVNAMIKAENTTAAQKFAFSDGYKITAKYVGIKIIKSSAADESKTAHISEFAVYGTLLYGDNYQVTTATSMDVTSNHSKNMLLEAEVLSDYDSQVASKLTDAELQFIALAQNSYADIVYDFGASARISRILVSGGDKPISQYMIYASNDEATLFSHESRLVWENNTDGDESQHIDFNTEKIPSCRYIGFRVVDSSSLNAGAAELAVYGTLVKYYVDSDVTKTKVKNWSNDNLLCGINPSVSTLSTGSGIARFSNFNSINIITDGDAFGENKHTTVRLVEGDATITYDLNRNVTIDSFLLAQTTWLQNAFSYELYIGDNIETLYESEPYFTWDSSVNATQGQYITYIGNFRPVGRYVGIHITGTNQSGATSVMIGEIGLWGTPDYSDISVDYGITENDVSSLYEDNLLIETPVISNIQNEALNSSELLYDGNIADGFSNAVAISSTNNKLIVKLNKSAKISRLVMAGILNSVNNFGDVKIYAYSQTDNLFAYGKLVACVKAQDFNNAFKVDFAAKDYVNYIGIEFSDISSDVYLSEIEIFGTLMDWNVDVTVSEEDVSSWSSDNILKSVTPTFKNNNGEDFPTKNAVEEYVDGKLPEDVNSMSQLSKLGDWAMITYSFDKKYEFEKIVVGNFWNIPLCHYEVYVGNSIATLYNPSNRVIAYDNTVNGYTATQSFTLAPENVRSGKLIGFKFISGDNFSKDAYLRLSELMAFGNQYIPKLDNLAENLPINIYRTTSSANRKALTDSEFNLTDKKNVTSASNTEVVSISSKGKDIDIVIDMCQKTDIESIVLKYQNNAPKKLSVYTAYYEEDVWYNSKTVEYTRSSSSEKQSTIPCKISTRYVRIHIPASALVGSTLKLLSVQIIGLDDQKQDIDNQLYNFASDNISLYLQNIETKEMTESFSIQARSSMTDGSQAYGSAIWGAAYGTESLNLVFKFDSLKVLNKVVLYTLENDLYEHYGIKELEIYTANNLIDLFAADATPLAIYKNTESPLNKTEHVIDFISNPCIYLRICILDSCDDYSSPLSMMAVFTEIEAYGLSVENILPDDDDGVYAAKFKDTTTGVTASFLKLFDNDVMSSIYRMEVVTSEVSKKQVDELASLGVEPCSLKYEIRFYDRAGNLVTNFDGRQVTITIPIPSDYKIVYLVGDKAGALTVLDASYLSDAFSFDVADGSSVFKFIVVTNLSGSSGPVIQLGQQSDFEEKEEVVGETEEENGKRKKIIAIRHEVVNDYTYLYFVIPAVCLLIGGIVFIVIRKKRKKRNVQNEVQEENGQN